MVLQAPKHKPANVTPTSDGPGGCESGHHAALGRTGASDPSRHLGTEPSVQGERDTLKPAGQPLPRQGPPCPCPCPPPSGRAVIPGDWASQGSQASQAERVTPRIQSSKTMKTRTTSDSSKNRLFLVSSPQEGSVAAARAASNPWCARKG